MEGINYERDLWNAAAVALQERDVDTLESLVRVSESWLGDEADRLARGVALNAMLEAAWDLEAAEAS